MRVFPWNYPLTSILSPRGEEDLFSFFVQTNMEHINKLIESFAERLPSWLKAPLSKSGSPARRRGFGDAVEDGGGGGSEASEHIPPAGESRDGSCQRRWDENPGKS